MVRLRVEKKGRKEHQITDFEERMQTNMVGKCPFSFRNWTQTLTLIDDSKVNRVSLLSKQSD